jgi:serine/threonine-protein kinase
VRTALAIDPDLAPELVTICARATALDPKDRYASVARLIARLEQFLDGDRDTSLRKRLSRTHSDSAATAIDGNGDGAGDGDELGQRRAALNQLGRALALDADNRDAMKLLVRLLTEPPKALPAEVAESLDRDEERSVTRAARVGTWLFASLIGFVPLTMWMGVRSWTMVGGIVVLVLWCIGALAATGRWWPANQQGLYPAYVASSMTIAGIATLFGPLVVVPGMAAVNTVTFLMQFRRVRWWPVVVGCASFSVPLGLQQLGVLRPSYLFARGRMELVPWALDLSRVPSLTFLTLSALAVLVTGAVMTMHFRRALNEANVQTRLHSWHLRQLVPAAEAPRPAARARPAAGASDTLSPPRRARSR